MSRTKTSALLAFILLASFVLSACSVSLSFTTGDPTPAPATCTTACTDGPTTTNPINTNLAYFAGGHQGWDNGPKNVNFVGTMNLAQLRSGISMQANWSKWFYDTNATFLGYTVPQAFEPCNDGCPQILVVNDTGYIPNRDPNTGGVHFWDISYIQLTDHGLLVCTDDTGNPGSWIGECAGSSQILKGFPLSEIAERLPEDLQHHWTALQEIMSDTNATPNYGTISTLWLNP